MAQVVRAPAVLLVRGVGGLAVARRLEGAAAPPREALGTPLPAETLAARLVAQATLPPAEAPAARRVATPPVGARQAAAQESAAALPAVISAR